MAKREVKKEDVLAALAKLAFGKPNDGVALAYREEPDERALKKMDLSALAEFKRVSSGTVEVKFVDRVKALTALYELLGRESGGAETEEFFRALEKAGEEDEAER